MPGGEPLHEQHRPAALRTAPQAGLLDSGLWQGIQTPSRRRIGFDQMSAQRKEFTAVAGAEDPEVPNADEAWGQDMQQEASQKLLDRQAQATLLIVVCGVAPSEGDL